MVLVSNSRGPLKGLRKTGWGKYIREVKDPTLHVKYNIHVYPTFVLVEGDKEIRRVTGYHDQWEIGQFYKDAEDSSTLPTNSWRNALAKVDGCSGVCIHPSGVILTVKHCDISKRVKVKLNGEVVWAKRMFVAKGRDSAVYVKVEGDRTDWPFLNIAKKAPVAGDKIYSLGFPGRWGKHFYSFNEGKVLGYETYRKVKCNRSQVGVVGLGFWGSRRWGNRRHLSHVAGDHGRPDCPAAA